MVQFGYKLMSEEHGARDLIENAVRAKAAATIALISENRFTLAISASERLTEHITGAVWPSAPERHAMLGEAIDIFRVLWMGEVATHKGAHFQIDHARLYDVPDKPIPLVTGVSGPASSKLATEKKVDGIMATEPKKELTAAFKKRPCYSEAALAYAPSAEKAKAVAKERFAFSALGWHVNTELPTPTSFEAAVKYVRAEDLSETIGMGPDVDRHVAAVKPYIDAGFDHIALVGIGPDQAAFIDFFEKELGPKLRALG